MTSNTSFQSLLACKVSLEKSADSLMGTPLQVTASFTLSAFKILFLSLILGNLIMMCLSVFLLECNFFGPLWASWTSWKSMSFARLGKFFIMFSSKFSISWSSSSPSGTPMIQMLEHLKLSHKFLSLSSYFWIPVSSFCSGWMFISSFCYKSLIWIPVSFPSLLVPCTFSPMLPPTPPRS